MLPTMLGAAVFHVATRFNILFLYLHFRLRKTLRLCVDNKFCTRVFREYWPSFS